MQDAVGVYQGYCLKGAECWRPVPRQACKPSVEQMQCAIEAAGDGHTVEALTWDRAMKAQSAGGESPGEVAGDCSSEPSMPQTPLEMVKEPMPLDGSEVVCVRV